MGGRAAHQLPQSVLLSLHVPAEARPRLKARTRVRKSMCRHSRCLRGKRKPFARLLVNHGTAGP